VALKFYSCATGGNAFAKATAFEGGCGSAEQICFVYFLTKEVFQALAMAERLLNIVLTA